MSKTNLDEYELIDGSFSTGCSQEIEFIAQSLVDLVEASPELLDLNGSVELEVEGRIGTLINENTKDKVVLPVEGISLLLPSEKEFSYRFAPGVEKWQMTSIAEELRKDFDESKVPYVLKTRNTSDYYIRNYISPEGKDKTLIRLSYLSPKNQKDKPVEAIWKEKIAVFDFCSPGQSGEFEDKYNVESGTLLRDFRIAINLEHKENPIEVASTITGPIENSCVLERRRERETIEVSNFVLDSTHVVQIEGRRGFRQCETYELELELKQSHLIPLLKSYIEDTNHGKLKVIGTHPFIKLLTNFVNLVFGITLFLNNKKSNDLTDAGSGQNAAGDENIIMDLTSCTQPDDLVQAFQKYVSPVTPIIGDYLYRAVASEKLKLGRPEDVVGEEDIDISLGIKPPKLDFNES
ncbi:Ctl1p-like mRNA capping enzyme beta subunit (polynucleotide 5'-triphosphatase) [Cryptosporidium canis]|uniref:mRNA 5'-phosphatase n=1 Tax=Cryptosporidium canis TaxID=195482 RepID=A0ABQ8P5C6_9CRYT|nr:Ctl1p-like mRNA capping enzyme beta subunit (polynucleotide 5'-triphosphatase) [Cryptosporidium canis]KAJ1607717.1 Ctl1p-like mRNA capping enzyme beta subunit (polynucleotide 5'-triphosphatase) [Cryptosporidium canis]